MAQRPGAAANAATTRSGGDVHAVGDELHDHDGAVQGRAGERGRHGVVQVGDGVGAVDGLGLGVAVRDGGAPAPEGGDDRGRARELWCDGDQPHRPRRTQPLGERRVGRGERGAVVGPGAGGGEERALEVGADDPRGAGGQGGQGDEARVPALLRVR